MSDPVAAVNCPPLVSREDLVMMLITPFTALAPQTVPPGPRITSIRSMSSSGIPIWSQFTPEKMGL
jgi:hypothetical protein